MGGAAKDFCKRTETQTNTSKNITTDIDDDAALEKEGDSTFHQRIEKEQDIVDKICSDHNNSSSE